MSAPFILPVPEPAGPSRVGSNEQRTLVLAPTGKDMALIIRELQRAGIDAQRCDDGEQLVDETQRGVGAVLLAEEAIRSQADRESLQRMVREQPSWSDLPVLLLAKAGPFSSRASNALREMGNVTVLARPTQIATLVSAVMTALRTRERQYGLRTAEQRKDAFLAMLAHELRNPLAPLGNALQLLRRDGLGAQERQWALDVAQRQSRQLVRLVDDLLDVARITQGQVGLRLQPVALADVMRNAAEISAPLIDSLGHTLAMQLPDFDVMLDADAVRLAQCLSNLLNNAARYTPRGGRIEFDARVAAHEVELQVRDNGVGIPAHAMAHLFDLFSQVDRTRSQAQGGLGIGLSIVKTFVEMHGGRVEAHSDGEGRGATFALHLPRPAAGVRPPVHEPEGAPTPQPAASTALPLRVVLVDDNIDSADSLCELLSACGHEVHCAYDGVSGLAALMRVRPDVAILDIGLPDIDGLELARRVRACADGWQPVLIALSGWGQPLDRERTAAAGFDEHLIKPAEPSVLFMLLDPAREAAARRRAAST